MDERRFDALTTLVADGGSRRAFARLVASGVLGGLAALVAHAGDEADATSHRPKPKPPHSAKPARSQQGAKHHRHDHPSHDGETAPSPTPSQPAAPAKTDAAVPRTTRKHHHHKPPPLPPGCADCTDCQMCRDGACVADPALERVRCQGSGAACGYCQGGQCAAAEALPCADGTCPRKGRCCRGEKRCVDPESSTGFACVDAKTQCCPGERRCAGGACVSAAKCCPEEWTCGDGSCVPQDQCCPDEERCPNGSCVARGVCCAGQRPCADGSCVGSDECCPSATPCTSCQVRVCVNGTYVCRPGPDGTNCQMVPGDAPGYCCHGQCTREQIVCPAYPWRAYNPATCLCECPDGSVDEPGSERLCCPAGFPHLGIGGFGCSADDGRQWVCPLGHHVCPDNPNRCCRDGL